MSVNLFAWASIDENGNARGGKAGNQTGKELKVAPLYEFGAKKLVRFRSRERGRTAAKIALSLAKNQSIGYNQDSRGTLYQLALTCKWDITTLTNALTTTKVNCDCSSFVATVINLSYKRKKVPCFTTATMCNYLPQRNFKIKKYPPKKFKKGDMPLAEGKHVIINV